MLMIRQIQNSTCDVYLQGWSQLSASVAIVFENFLSIDFDMQAYSDSPLAITFENYSLALLRHYCHASCQLCVVSTANGRKDS